MRSVKAPCAVFFNTNIIVNVCMKKRDRLLKICCTFVEIMCFELIGFNKILVNYLVRLFVIFNELVALQCVTFLGRELRVQIHNHSV